jgi:hypothetical protein
VAAPSLTSAQFRSEHRAVVAAPAKSPRNARPGYYHRSEDVVAKQRAKERRAKRRAKAEAKTDSGLGEVDNAAGEPIETSSEACAENLALAAKRGLTLPDGWAMHCVGPGSDWNGTSHWGVTCPYDSCPEGAGPYVSISNPTYYVVAHELCHANYGNDELMADSCAAEHGASLAESPYQ